MNKIDLVRLGLKNLWRRKLRTFLTILGVVIGTTSILLMVSLGIGMNESFKNTVEEMGSLSIINVYKPFNYEGMEENDTPRMNRNAKLNDIAVAKMSKIPGVDVVNPHLETQLKLISGRYSAYVPVVGIEPEAMKKLGFEVEKGRLLNENDKLSLVFSNGIKRRFRKSGSRNRYGESEEPDIDLLEDRMELTYDMNYGERKSTDDKDNKRPVRPYRVTGVGVLKEGKRLNRRWAVYMTMDQVKEIIEDKKKYEKRQSRSRNGMMGRDNTDEYEQVEVKVKDINDVNEIQEKIKNMGFETFSPNDMLESMKDASAGIRKVLGAIGAVSLLIAAIGITNTMIMSIYERTREIGIMKVIGALISDIKKLFLFEASMIGFLGGVLGVGISYLASYVLNNSGFELISTYATEGPGKISIIPMWLALGALGFSTIVGLVAGYFPARRAMKLSALKAIKTE
ncbi:ABC transporter permease [Dethiothermospora halolimnae]|uniref:ABC transporter permease n=1 Tax=Dethiothermospora halolimnae TaxID=3114390 RepID=UPI003CCB921F